MAKENKNSAQVVKICPTVEELQFPDLADCKSRYVCPVKDCNAFPFKSQRGLKAHTNNSHPELRTSASKDSGNAVLKFHCPQKDCVYYSHGESDQRWFSTFGQLKYHYINTHGEKRFTCSKCQKGFGWERDRDYHQLECGKTYNCAVCTAKYPSRRALLTHCTRKQHPVPPEFNKPEKRVKATPAVQNRSVSSCVTGQDSSLLAGCVTATPHIIGCQSGAGHTVRPILPKGLKLISPDSVPVLGGCDVHIEPQTTSSSSSSTLVHTSVSAVHRTHGVGSQTAGKEACMADHRVASYPLEICHMGTQASGPALCSIASSQITDMGVQATVEVAHSGTQMAECSHHVENAAIQTAAVLVNSATQMGRPVSAIGIQTGSRAQVANMAIQATNHLPGFAHIATQVPGSAVGVHNISVQASEPFTLPDMTQGPVNLRMYDSGSMSGVHMATQASFSSVTVSSDTDKMNAMAAVCQPEESAMASTGMQTSVTLIPSRPKLGVMAETQTSGDYILQSAMVSAEIPVLKPRKKHKATGCSPRRKRTTKSSEAQTHHCSLQRKKRRMRKSMEHHLDSNLSSQTVSTLSMQQNNSRSSLISGQKDPHLSSSTAATAEMWDPLLSSSVRPVSSLSGHSSMQPSQLDEFLSTYTSDLGVQTRGYFPTVDLGVQTHISSLFSSNTAEFGVQTLDRSQEMGTADSGVQTVTPCAVSLLDDFDGDVGYNELVDATMGSDSSTMSAFMSGVDCGTGTEVSTLDSQTQTSMTTASTVSGLHVGVQFTDCGIDMECSLSPLNLPANQKLFESFDSDLSFSDCGTGTEDIWASTHTQTAAVNPVDDSDVIGNMFSRWTEDSSSQGHTQTMVEQSVDSAMMDLFQSTDSQPCSENESILTNSEVYQRISDDSQSSILKSCSSTEMSQLSEVAAASDMHTQTADDLLDFLMKNMETQTTEDITENSVAMADIDTQTTGSILFTPPHPFSPGTSPSWLGEDSMGLVTTETQTWGPFEDKGDLFSFTDMETQTTLDYQIN